MPSTILSFTIVADSTTSTGLKWAAPASGSTFVGCSLYKSGTQSISNNTATAITFNVENFDSDGFHDNSTNNSRITIPSGKGGKYLLTGSVGWGGGTTGVRIPWLYKNGSSFNIMATIAADSGGNDVRVTFAYTIDLVATDYVELFGFQTNGDNRNVTDGQNTTTFAATYLGA